MQAFSFLVEKVSGEFGTGRAKNLPLQTQASQEALYSDLSPLKTAAAHNIILRSNETGHHSP